MVGVEVAAAAAAEVGVEEAAVEVGAAAGAQELGLAASVDGDGDDAFSGPSQCAPSFLTWEPSLQRKEKVVRLWGRDHELALDEEDMDMGHLGQGLVTLKMHLNWAIIGRKKCVACHLSIYL